MVIKNLDIYFSDACNLDCPYCILKDNNHISTNKAIQQALQDESFAQKVKETLTQDTISIGIWGKEPGINGIYFKQFIYDILNYSSYIQAIALPTNAMFDIWSYFVSPLVDYCNQHKRNLKLYLQVSLDGPIPIHDKHRGQGAFLQAFNNFKTVCANMRTTDYLLLIPATKITFQAEDWRYNIRDYWAEMKRHYENLTSVIQDTRIRTDLLFGHPTPEIPGNYTKEDGEYYAKWQPNYDPLYTPPVMCMAGIESFTIDYTGQLYDCHCLKNLVPETERINYKVPLWTDIAWDLMEDDEIQIVPNYEPEDYYDYLDEIALLRCVEQIYCPLSTETDWPSYMRLLGNGAVGDFVTNGENDWTSQQPYLDERVCKKWFL